MNVSSGVFRKGAPQVLGATEASLPVFGEVMAPVVERLRSFSKQNETLLITGPTGAGKSRLAKWCHEQSGRARGPFEAVDLNSIPEDLQLGHLFGWRKGAFTSAVNQGEGAFERAAGGTLFLDEVDKLSPRTQAGLLEVLEQRTYRPLGMSGRPLDADVRFIVGTNADLTASVHAGRFREDLYYRINVLSARLPSLAERRDEIIPWARFMLQRRHLESGEGDRGQLVWSPEAEQLLLAHDWPGNLRELDNVVRRAYALGGVSVGENGTVRVVEEQTVRDAMGPRPPGRSHGSELLEMLERTASEFVAEARRRRHLGQSFDLDLADALRGFVLRTALQETGSVEEALEILGKRSLLVGRNHHKFIRAEMRRVEAIGGALGKTV